MECPSLRTAFMASVPAGALRVGDWVRLSGIVRTDPGLKQNGQPREENLAYYHQPHDGSDKSTWWFFRMADSSADLTVDPSVCDKVMAAVSGLNRVVESWHSLSSDELVSIIATVASATSEVTRAYRVRAKLEADLRAPVDAPDVSV